MLLNMSQHEIKISDSDIAYTERILFGKAGAFYDNEGERKAFIKNLNTVDLQAVPGSGKTTVLLAKLLILERHLQFKDGSGILVISHTNTAVDEIRNRIGKYCPSSRLRTPALQAKVCFLCFPSGFPMVPQYFRHTQLFLSPSRNRTSSFPTSGSSLKHSEFG